MDCIYYLEQNIHNEYYVNSSREVSPKNKYMDQVPLDEALLYRTNPKSGL